MTAGIQQNRMYEEFAHLWTQISPPEDYAEEAVEIREAIFELLPHGPEVHRPSLLELGVGGGNNLSHLAPFFDAVGTDLSPQMLEVSKQLNPDVEHLVGDMRELRLQRKFDVVIVMDAISYMLTEDDLRKAFRTAREHLDLGGVFMAGPDWLRGITPVPSISSRLGGTGQLSYSEFVFDSNQEDNEIDLIFTYFLPQDDGSVVVEEDRHRHGYFPLETWLLTMRDAGFEAGTRRYPAETTGGSGYHITGIAI